MKMDQWIDESKQSEYEQGTEVRREAEQSESRRKTSRSRERERE